MKVFVLLGGFDYEGSTVLGVFASNESAKTSAQFHKDHAGTHIDDIYYSRYDDYEVVEFELQD